MDREAFEAAPEEQSKRLKVMDQLQIQAKNILRDSLGNAQAEFHEHQWEAIATVIQGEGRLLVVQRTGWGKSAVYFIATRILRERGKGPALIISPLLALMRNQVEAAGRYGVSLGAINSAQSQDENDRVGDALRAGEMDAVIISPERLSNDKFMEEVLRPISNNVGLLVVDEAHCISDWGHDFRPDYKRIINLLQFLPDNLPVLATTATANERVMEDVAGQLGSHPQILRGHLMRESLQLQTIDLPRRSQRLAWLAEALRGIEGTGIVYVATTRDAELVARWLRSQGLPVEAYYGTIRGLSSEENREERLRREEALLNNRIKALVATSALGMGYDKPDLAFVIHFQSPGSAVSYYQQVGRAGRGIPRAYGVLMSGSEDDVIQQHFIRSAFPRAEVVEEILQVIGASEGGLRIFEIESRINAAQGKISGAVKFLAAESPAPIVKEKGLYRRTLRDYELPYDLIQRVSDNKRHEWRRMQSYLEHQGCLMQFLARELDDHASQPCGKCMNCLGEPPIPLAYQHDTGVAATDFMERVLIPIAARKMAGPPSEVKNRFPTERFSTQFGELKHEEGRALCYWGEAGWGEIAMHGKRTGQFDPRLVTASAKMVRERWNPDPMPEWVCYVPSLGHPRLVPEFARLLAGRLELPLVDAIEQTRPNSAQKEMENSFHRCRNLDGVFRVIPTIPDGAVLLVDDAVDSGWTFAVTAALLRRAGAGPVFPFAIVSTSSAG